MKLLKNFKLLKGSSLLESVIAIVIISTCLLVSMVVYMNVVKQNDSVHYFNAKHKIEKIIKKNIIEREYENDTYIYKGYKIEKTVLVNDDKTVLLEFNVKTGDKVYHFKRLISYEK